jgi:hypothetical protein
MRTVISAMSFKSFHEEPLFALQSHKQKVRRFCPAASDAARFLPLVKAVIASSGREDYSRIALLRTFREETTSDCSVDMIARRPARSIGPIAACGCSRAFPNLTKVLI